MLHDQQYFQAVFHSLEYVKAIYRAQDEIVMANEAIGSELSYASLKRKRTDHVQRITLRSRMDCTN